MLIEADTLALLKANGVHGHGAHLIEQSWRGTDGMSIAMDAMPDLAMDAQPGMITTANGGIPAFLANIMDPEVVQVLTSPVRAAEIFEEKKKGDWTTATAEFPFVEPVGETSSYGDWNNNGSVSANVNWMARQSYHFQTIAQWGEREIARYGLAGIDYVSQIESSAAWVMAKFLNKSYFFGVSGLLNYGILNDPNLNAAISPLTKAAGGLLWSNATAVEVFNDINEMFRVLTVTLNGLVVNSDAKMTLALPAAMVANLNKVSSFNVSAMQTIKETFPNLRIETAPEYATQSGNVAQLILDEFEGVDTAYVAFTEKQRSHAVVTDLSGWKQKKSGGTWGWINRRPACIVTMSGI